MSIERGKAMENHSNYTGQYINYNSIHDYKEIWKFINEGKVYSNVSKNLESTVTKLIEYEKRRKTNNKTNRQKVYAIELVLMLPHHLAKQKKHDILRSFMIKISPVFKKVIYMYSFERIGRGDYCRIIVFQRMLYKQKHLQPVKYKRDMWINKVTGYTTNAEDPDALQICCKNAIKLDKDGNKVYEEIEISPRKYRYLNFKDDSDIEAKMRKFNSFKNRLSRYLVFAISKSLSMQAIYMKLRHKRFVDNNNEISKRILLYNSVINRINIQLRLLQNTFYFKGLIDENRKEAWKEFEHVFYNINQILKNGYFYPRPKHDYERERPNSKNVRQMIDPKCKLSLWEYKLNLSIFEGIAKRKIQQWNIKQFYDPIYFNVSD